MATPSDTITKLRACGQFLATLQRHREHMEACAKSGVEPDSFAKFAEEVLNTPADKREWLLAPDEVANYEPATRYAQYEMPKGEDLLFGTHRRKK